MNMKYKEPLFKIVVSSSKDVITTSGEEIINYTPGTFESDIIPLE